jgi:hypothetical protein
MDVGPMLLQLVEVPPPYRSMLVQELFRHKPSINQFWWQEEEGVLENFPLITG